MDSIKIKCSEPTCTDGFVEYEPIEIPIVLGFRAFFQNPDLAVDYEEFKKATPVVLSRLNKQTDETETVVLLCKPNGHVRSYEVIKS